MGSGLGQRQRREDEFGLFSAHCPLPTAHYFFARAAASARMASGSSSKSSLQPEQQTQ
jgi:hypothetical protein